MGALGCWNGRQVSVRSDYSISSWPLPLLSPLAFSSHSSSNSTLNSVILPAGPSRSALTSKVGRAGGFSVTDSEPAFRLIAFPLSRLSATFRRYDAISSRLWLLSDLNRTSSGIIYDTLPALISEFPILTTGNHL